MYSIKTKLDVEANDRDGNRCISCGKKSGIETHHIVPGLEELNNLKTLCHGCHKKEHDMAGCFKEGYDEKRHIPPKEKLRAMSKEHGFKKGIYFNRWINSWVGKKQQYQ